MLTLVERVIGNVDDFLTVSSLLDDFAEVVTIFSELLFATTERLDRSTGLSFSITVLSFIRGKGLDGQLSSTSSLLSLFVETSILQGEGDVDMTSSDESSFPSSMLLIC